MAEFRGSPAPGEGCRAALEAISAASGGDMRVWRGRPDLLWLRYLWATRENDYNRARVADLGSVADRETLAYVRRTLAHLAAVGGDWTPGERDGAALVLVWAEAAKGGMPLERAAWAREGVSLVDHANGSAALFLRAASAAPEAFPPPAPGLSPGVVSLLIRMHGALGQYLQGEVSPESGTLPFASPGELAWLEALCHGAGCPFPTFCRVLALASKCVLAGVSPELAARHRGALASLAAGELLPPLSPRERVRRLCGGGEGSVDLSPRAEALLAQADLWYADGAFRAMGLPGAVVFLNALAASIPPPPGGERPECPTPASWRPGPMLSLKGLQDQLYFYSGGLRHTDHCMLAMVERSAEGGVLSPTDHLAFRFLPSQGGGEGNLLLELTPTGGAIDQFYRALVVSDIIHNKAILAVFDQLGYRSDIFDRVGNEDQYLRHMNSAADDKRRLLEEIRDGDKVLDVGPGGGVLLELIQSERPGCALAGADISTEVCQRLCRKAADRGLAWRVIHSGFLELTEERVGRFDVIVFCSIIHEIFSYGEYQGRRFNKAVVPEILKTAAGLLNPGGRVVIRDGVAADQNPTVNLLFRDGELEALARDYLGQFRGFPLLAEGPEATGQAHLYRMPANSMMELLYTVTWGKDSLPFEVEEWYGYYSEAEWRALGEQLAGPGGPGLRLRSFTQYLQPGYVSHLAGRVELTALDGTPIPFPNSNMVAVFEKTAERSGEWTP